VTSTASGDDSATLDYYLPTLNAQYASSLGYDGSGIGVAVIDSGITDIPDLHGHDYRVIYAQDFTGINATVDQYAHGTHVAGIIGGNGKNSTGSNYSYTIRGLAPNVNLINLRVLDANGAGSDSAVIKAIETAINLKSKYNIRVINLSLGRGVFESYQQDPLCQAVEQAYNAGIVVVVAAGNGGRDNSYGTNGYGTITAPGNDPYVITMGAMKTMGTPTRADDLIATYSSKGPTLFDHVVKPDLVAPGNRIVSLYTAGLTLPQELSWQRDSLFPVSGERELNSLLDLLQVERHQHGRTDGQRNRGVDAPAEPRTHAGSGESAADEDSIENLSELQQLHGSNDQRHIHQPVRRVHYWGRLPRCAGCALEYRSQLGPGEIAGRAIRPCYRQCLLCRGLFNHVGHFDDVGHHHRVG
jgi:subtilisin family serine protease